MPLQTEVLEYPAPLEPKVYVLVRRDLPWPVRTVQAMHVVMQLIREISYKVDWGVYGPSIVLLGVKDEAELSYWLEQLIDNSIHWPVVFREPDMNNALTAIASHGQPIPELIELKLM